MTAVLLESLYLSVSVTWFDVILWISSCLKKLQSSLPTKPHLSVEILAVNISKTCHFAHTVFDDPTVYVFLINLSP